MTLELEATLKKWLVSADPVQRRHAELRLAEANLIPSGPVPIPLAESLVLFQIIHGCLYRSRDAACGCTGHRCGLRSAALVSHLDCLECVKVHGHA